MLQFLVNEFFKVVRGDFGFGLTPACAGISYAEAQPILLDVNTPFGN
jgi:hypothetical protein